MKAASLRALGAFMAALLIHLSYLSILLSRSLFFVAVPHGVIYAPYNNVDIINDLATLTIIFGSTFEYLFSLAVGAVAK